MNLGHMAENAYNAQGTYIPVAHAGSSTSLRNPFVEDEFPDGDRRYRIFMLSQGIVPCRVTSSIKAGLHAPGMWGRGPCCSSRDEIRDVDRLNPSALSDQSKEWRT
jgi:hypothetical protein